MADRKGNTAGGNKPVEETVDMTKPLIDSLDELNRKAQRVIVSDAKKYITETSNYALKKIKEVSNQIDAMSKKGVNITVNGKTVKSKSIGNNNEVAVDVDTSSLERASDKLERQWEKAYERANGKAQPLTKSGKSREDNLAKAVENYENVKKQFEKGKATEEEYKSAFEGLKKAENAKIPMAEKAIGTIKDYAIKGLQEIIKYVGNEFASGVNDYIRNYNDKFSSVASRTSSAYDNGTYSRSGTNKAFTDILNENKKQYKSALNINKDLMPAFDKMIEAGYQEGKLTSATIDSAVDSKIMPWINNASETWVTLNSTLDKNRVESLKSAQLQLQEIKGGNRLLQTGIIEQLTSEMIPTLANIDYNTMDENKLDSGLQSIMSGLVDKAGYTKEQAYAVAKEIYSTQNDEYKALTSGSTYQKSLVINAQENGGDYIESFLDTSKNFIDMMKGSGNIGVGAQMSAFGTSDVIGGRARETQIDKLYDLYNSGDFAETVRENQQKLEDGKNKNQYDDAKKNLNIFSSSTTVFKNAISNFGTSISDFIKAMPANDLVGGFIGGLPNMLATFIGGKAVKGAVEKGFSKLAGEALKSGTGKIAKSGAEAVAKNSGGLLGSAGSSVGTFLSSSSGITTATGSSLSMGGALAGGAGIFAGLMMMGKDAIDGTKKAKDWGVSGGKAGLTSALLGDEEAGGKKALKQATKYGAIGAGVGTFIGGPLGTVVGGAIGAGVGALTGFVDTKKVAQWWQNKSDERKDKKAQKQAEKEQSKQLKEEKGIIPYVKSIINLIKKLIVVNGGNASENDSGLSTKLSLSNSTGKAKQVAKTVFGLTPTGAILNRVLDDKNNKDSKNSKSKSQEEKVVDAIFTVGSAIVDAINKGSEIDRDNGLLPTRRNDAINKNMVNLYAGNLSTGSLV